MTTTPTNSNAKVNQNRDYVVTLWSLTGPRDQTNCINGWGIRRVKVSATSEGDAIVKARIAAPKSGQLIGVSLANNTD